MTTDVVQRAKEALDPVLQMDIIGHHDALERVVPELVAEVSRLRAQIAAVRELHQRVKNRPHCYNRGCPCAQPEWVCSCGEWHRYYESQTWPCPTIRALDGEDAP